MFNQSLFCNRKWCFRPSNLLVVRQPKVEPKFEFQNCATNFCHWKWDFKLLKVHLAARINKGILREMEVKIVHFYSSSESLCLFLLLYSSLLFFDMFLEDYKFLVQNLEICLSYSLWRFEGYPLFTLKISSRDKFFRCLPLITTFLHLLWVSFQLACHF